MKKAHRKQKVKRELAARDISNWSEVREHIAAQFEKVVALSRRQYGHLFETTWWYENEWCPCCGRRRVGMWADRAGQASMSLNGFVYKERRVLIGYLLCLSCVEALRRAAPERQAELHQQIEARLMRAYEQAVDEESASGVAGIVD